jgi:hypothetical protein
MHADVASGSILHTSHELDQLGVDHSRICPPGIERCGGGDVLATPLMNVANGSMSLPGQNAAHSS